MKILVISLAGIGDTLIATPLIHELRLLYPKAKIDALVLWKGSQDLLQGNPHVDRVHQKNFIQAGPVGSLPFLQALRRELYDISLNTHPQSRTSYRWVARWIGAPVRMSHVYDRWSPLDRCLVNRSLPQNYQTHGVQNNLDLLQLLDRKPMLSNHDLEIFLTPEELAWADDYFVSHGIQDRFCLGIHMGSGGTKNLALKRWPLDCYAQLIARLAKAHPEVTVLLFGGPEEREAHESILRQNHGAAVLAPETANLRQTAALFRKLRCFLSVDTALMHLAAAMKVPKQIVIEAPTLNTTNVPWQNPYRLVPNPAVRGRNLDYYRYDGKPIKGSQAELVALMRSVTVDAVLETFEEVLSQKSGRDGPTQGPTSPSQTARKN